MTTPRREHSTLTHTRCRFLCVCERESISLVLSLLVHNKRDDHKSAPRNDYKEKERRESLASLSATESREIASEKAEEEHSKSGGGVLLAI
jgi:hypothetical protein